ncbi:MAG: glycosyltransferase family 4 protein [Thermodesulfovibrionales bacterium]|nr:glycosyltransferase family 4 protein [Thermodesulfovibrionales bacterium]
MKRYTSITIIAPDSATDMVTNIGVRYLPLNRGTSILKRLTAIPQAVRVLLRLAPDVCHFHDFEFLFALPLLKLLCRSKIIYDVHEAYPEAALASPIIPAFLRPFVALIVDKTEQILSRLADYIITSDERIAERFYGRGSNLEIIFNYPDLIMFEQNKERIAELNHSYEGRIPIIYQGSMAEDRGLFHMIEAMDILKSVRPEVLLILAGNMSDALSRRVHSMIKSKSLHKQIDVLGWIPHKDIVNYITIAKVGLVPLLPTEKFKKNIPIKQFEYMACGVPILGANLHPIASYVLKAGCGKVYDSTRPDALACGVMELLEDEQEWRRMSESGKRAVRDLWNWDEMEKRLLRVYENILGSCNEDERGASKKVGRES